MSGLAEKKKSSSSASKSSKTGKSTRSKTVQYAERINGQTKAIGSSSSRKAAGSVSSASKKGGGSVSRKSSASKGRSSRSRKKGYNWGFIIAGAILVSSYMIIVLFNGFGQMHWEESLNELKSSFMGAFQSVGDLFNQVGKQLGSSSTSEDLILDPPVGQQVRVHFIDVGQGESVLIEGGGESVLIDAGENNQGETVLSYLEKAGIDQLTMAVGTHPHSDHIGGMDTVMQGITVGKLLMPDLPDDLIPTTKTYLSVLDAAEQTQTEMVYAYPGDSWQICGGKLTVLGPVEDYDDLNDESLVMRFDYGETSFLLTGDQEADAEEDLLASGADVDADLLGVGHHGSSTSTSQSFLDAVSPSVAVISCGEGNDYGHPHMETTQRLEEAGVEIYRTDLQGSIVATSDGQKLTVSTEKAG